MCCRVRQFLCGCSLRSGAITATVLTSISVLGFLIVGATLLFWHDTFMEVIEKSLDEQIRLAKANNQKIEMDEAKMRESINTVSSVITIFGWVLLSFALIGLLIVISLSISLCTEKAGFVIPWLIGAMIEIVLSCIAIVVLVIFGLFFALAGLFQIAFMIYMWIVVYNFHLELKGRPMYISPPMKA